MADFDEVHRKYIDAARGRVRLGEIWNIGLREPFGMVDMSAAAVGADSFVVVVRFKALGDGRLEPAGASDRAAIVDWKNRHRHTSPESFGLPLGLGVS